MPHFKKSLKLHHFKLDRDELWQDCFSCKYVLTDWVGFFYLTSDFQDGGHDVILRQKVLPSVECKCSVHLVPADAFAA